MGVMLLEDQTVQGNLWTSQTQSPTGVIPGSRKEKKRVSIYFEVIPDLLHKFYSTISQLTAKWGSVKGQ